MDSSGGNVRAFGRAVRNRWRRSFVASITLLALLGVVPFAAALVLPLPYGPVRADVRRRTRRLELALGIVALLAYALALPGLLRAGRALRAQYDPRRVELVRELRQALRRDELSLHFQPIAEARGGRVATAEALVRWQHPRHGAVRPDRFVAMAEGTDV